MADGASRLPVPPARRRTETTRSRIRGAATQGPQSFVEQKVEDLVRDTERTTIDLVICAACQGLMHKPEEAGGLCAVCRQAMCVGCAKTRCHLCGQCVCLQHTTAAQGKLFCETHGMFQILALLISGR